METHHHHHLPPPPPLPHFHRHFLQFFPLHIHFHHLLLYPRYCCLFLEFHHLLFFPHLTFRAYICCILHLLKVYPRFQSIFLLLHSIHLVYTPPPPRLIATNHFLLFPS